VKPQIPDLETWNQAELLLQPAFIRLLDNFRKALENSQWQSHYQDIATWPDDATEAQKTQYEELMGKLEQAKPSEVAEIENLLAQIPEPLMAYELQLSHGEKTLKFDLWQLCYQVCFCNYVPSDAPEDVPDMPGRTQAVAIDGTLLQQDAETGEDEVDWTALDDKVKAVVERLVHSLPLISV
jgi:hypothetical protein